MFIIGLSFLSLASFAASVNDSWDSLKGQLDLNIEWPAARMNHGPMTGVDFLCLDGDVLRTKAPVEKCLEWQVTRGHNSEVICVNSIQEYGFVNRQEMSTRCLAINKDGECVRYEDYIYVQPTTFPSVEVYQVLNNDGLQRKLFSKEYSIESCK